MAKEITGIVVSTKMQNTIVITVERKFRHPVYQKVITRHTKMKAHNEMKDINEGDTVVISETRPISKEKHFVVIKKLEEAKS